MLLPDQRKAGLSREFRVVPLVQHNATHTGVKGSMMLKRLAIGGSVLGLALFGLTGCGQDDLAPPPAGEQPPAEQQDPMEGLPDPDQPAGG